MTPGHTVRDLRSGETGTFLGWHWHCGYRRALVLIAGRVMRPLAGEVCRVMKPNKSLSTL